MNGKTDVLVIGGGPAGLAAAIAASQKGCQVVVADGDRPPLDKACGEGLLPEALRALGELGVRLGAEDGITFRGVRFIDKEVVAQAAFRDGRGMGVTRLTLHTRLLQRAEECGVRMMWGTPVTGITSRGVWAGGQEIPARWIVGADGTKSRARRWMGLGADQRPRYRVASRRHYRVPPWTEFMELYWGPGQQVYVTPVGVEEVCVVAIGQGRRVWFEAVWKEFPLLQKRLANAEMLGRERGAMTAMQSLTRVCDQRVALVGDASGGVDAITAQGLTLAFEQALALGNALEAGDLTRYQAEHRRLSRRPAFLGKILLLMGTNATLRGRAMKVLGSNPGIFSGMLALHSGEVWSRQLLVTTAQLGWRLLSA